MRFSWSTHLLCFSLETLTSIIRTDSPILVELIDLVNSVIIFLFQMTLLKWLTCLVESLTVNLTFLLFWITMTFSPLGNSDHVIVSVSFDFLLNSKRDARFHHIAYDYSCADWMAFMIIWKVFYGRISLNSVFCWCQWIFWVGSDWNWCIYLSSKILGQTSLIFMVSSSLCCCHSSYKSRFSFLPTK